MMTGERCEICGDPSQALEDGPSLCLRCRGEYKHFHCGTCGQSVLYLAVMPDLQPAADRCECSTCLMRKRAAALPAEDREAILAASYPSFVPGIRVAMERLGWSFSDANHLVHVLLTPDG
jgi:hypothetical protein